MSLLKLLTDAVGWKKKEAPKKTERAVKPEKLEKPVDTQMTIQDNRPVHMEKHRELTDEQKLTVVDLIAQGFTPTIVSKKMLEIHGVVFAPGNVYKYRDAEKWKPVIKELRRKYRENIHEIDMSHKANRLRLVEFVADKAVDKEDYTTALRAVEMGRKEFEKDGGDTNIFVNNPTYNELNVLSTDELVKKRDEATKKLLQMRTKEE